MLKRLIYTVILVGFVLILAHCGDDTVEPPMEEPLSPAEMARADSIANTWFTSLYDTLQALTVNSPDDLKNLRFDSMRSGFEKALDIEEGNELGHLGLALIELLEVNYSEDLWTFVDSLESWTDSLSWYLPFPPLPDFSADRHRTVIGNQFQLMVEMPMITIARAIGIPGNLSFGNVQNIIADDIIPRLSNAISHMAVVEESDTAAIRLCYEYDYFTECLRFDKGELMVFSAGLHALRSALYSAIAYDVDFLGPDGTYGWVDEYLDAEGFYRNYMLCCDYDFIEMGEVDDLDLTCFDFDSKYDAIADSILVSVAYYNVETRRDFLRLRNGGSPLRNAHADMLTAFTKLEQAAAFIRDPDRDETEENVVKLGDLTDFDDNIQGDPDLPNFMDGWSRLEDAITFGKAFLSGPVTFTEEIGPRHTEYTWHVDISRLFLTPVIDWNNLLPYYRWNLPPGAWIERETRGESGWDNGGWGFEFSVWDGEECVYTMFDNIGNIHQTRIGWTFDSYHIMEALDGPNGNPIDPDVVFPYFPDYTFNGLFPDMNSHIDWQALYNILK